jgi:hypothetical protein
LKRGNIIILEAIPIVTPIIKHHDIVANVIQKFGASTTSYLFHLNFRPSLVSIFIHIFLVDRLRELVKQIE